MNPSMESTSIGSFLQSSLSKAIGEVSVHKNDHNGHIIKTKRGAKRVPHDHLIESVRLETGEKMFQCRMKYCGQWLREGEEFALHSLTHYRRKSGDKENQLSSIKGKSCDEIVNQIHTDATQLSTVISIGQSNLFSLLSTSRTPSPPIATGTNGLSPAAPIGTKTDSIPHPSPTGSTRTAGKECVAETRVAPIPAKKRRFNWDLFVKGCVEEKMKNEGKTEDDTACGKERN